MKKILVTILALVYLITSTGVAIQMHYCMGELAGWGLGSDKSQTCSNCGMKESSEKENGCCKDKHMLIKNTADQKFTETCSFTTQDFSIILPANFIEFPPSIFSSVREEKPNKNAPPRSCGVAVYIRNCAYLI
ncbi:HYC_CC_PP family protein [Ferruginibacter sp.]|nr:hypothetical protein [Ferruginibacter sp.]